MKSILYFSAFFTFSSAVVISPDFETKLVSFIKASMKCRRIPGMTLAVVKGNESWSYGFGMEDISSNKAVDADSKFGIGSVTKAFTATLLGILLSEKGLDWKAKVTDILGPDYEFVDTYRTKELLLRDLLSHRTGLARLDGAGIGSLIPASVSRSAFCKRMKYLPEEIPIRDGFIYNNYMFMMLGHVAEKLGNDTWENLVTKRIFESLGMNSTIILKDKADIFRQHVARPYMYKNGAFQNGTPEIYSIYPQEPAGAIMSTAKDMSKWIKFNLKLGETESGKRLIDKKLMEDMRRVTTPIQNPNSLTRAVFPADDILFGYGYAWFLSEYRGFRIVGHGGSLNAYKTQLWTFPDMDIGLFTSVNGQESGESSYHHRMNSFYYITDYLFGLEPWLNETTTCSFPEPWGNKTKPEQKENEVPIQVDNDSEYEGSYGSHIFPNIAINSSSGDLHLYSNLARGILHPSSEKDRFLLEPTYPLEFASQGNNTQLVNATFQRDDASGVVNALTFQFEVNFTYFKIGSLLDTTTKQVPVIVG